jgi:L-ascorbate metabolism protein UlaG (beta-lactamase superfamily)
MAPEIQILKIKEKLLVSDSAIPVETSGNFSMSMWWLGQAGFYFRYRNYSLLIDPYLSDFLAQKYKGKEFPHIRMMPPPVGPEQFRSLDFVFCTHGHSDHMDPDTLSLLSKNIPQCKFIVPKAEKITAIGRGVAENQIIEVNADESLELNDAIKLDVLPSAHEEMKMNENAEHLFLGYVISVGPFKIYHSGDCIKYKGLSDKLKGLSVNTALLPVNGRDNYLSEKGIRGNFTFDEAVMLCIESEIPHLVAHHFGMFSFNTVDKETLLQKARQLGDENLNIIIPETDFRYQMTNPVNANYIHIK